MVVIISDLQSDHSSIRSYLDKTLFHPALDLLQAPEHSPVSTGLQATTMSDPGIPVKNTGFPFGYFRIRAAGTDNRYLQPYYHEMSDGNVLSLWDLERSNDELVRTTYIDGGVSIDIINNKLVVAHNRPTTEIQQCPNPWSHYLPTFSYSRETKMITIQFHADPVLSNDWPRPESEWKDKEFVLAARPPIVTRICKFTEIARWAPASIVPPLWTTRGGDRLPENDWTSVAAEEKLESISEEDLTRMRWEVETDV